MKRAWIVLVLLLTVLVIPRPAAAWAPPVPAGVVSVDTYGHGPLVRLIRDGYTDEIPWSDAYGDFVDVHAYVPGVSVDQAWDYVQDIDNLQEWTMSVRNVQPFGEWQGRTRYIADEHLPPGGNIYFLEQKDQASRTVDWWVGHAPEDIWMRYTMRVLDAQELLGKPGAVITWVNFGHANFQADPILQQGFLMMKIAHGFERDNLVSVLRYRAAGHPGPLDLQAMSDLGLFNVELYDPMQMWGIIASQVTPSVAWESYHGDFIGSHFYLPGVAPEEVWEYLGDADNLGDWTVSLRNLRAHGDGGFRAVERLSPHGAVTGRTISYPGSSTIDLQLGLARHCGHHGPPELVMNSTLRVLPASETNGMDGTVVVWIAYHHVALDDDPRFFEYWRYLPVRNAFGAHNVGVLLGVAPL